MLFVGYVINGLYLTVMYKKIITTFSFQLMDSLVIRVRLKFGGLYCFTGTVCWFQFSDGGFY